MSDNAPQVAVIGAGVAGLATAFNLERDAASRGVKLDLTLFESAAEIGGYLRTMRQKGYTIEVGPNGFLDNEPATLRLVDRLNVNALLQRSSDATRHRYLLVGGRMRALPMTPPAFIKSDLLSIGAKMRMACEFFIPPRDDLGRAALDPDTDETVYEFGRRRLGAEFSEVMLDPMVKGIFGGDARRLSLAAAFPRMVELEKNYGGLFKALIKLSRARKKSGQASASPGPSGVLHSFDGGMATLTDRLAGALHATIHTSSPISRVWSEGKRWHIAAGSKTFGPFGAVVDAAPAHAIAHHLADPDLCKQLAGIPYVPMAVITLAYHRSRVAHDLNGFGMLIPSREKRNLLGVLWSSSIFPGRSPEGKVLLRCMAGGPGRLDILQHDDASLVEMCLDDLRELYGLQGQPEDFWIIRHRQAIAQYEPGHLARLLEIERALDRQPGLFLTGSSYHGISVNYCVKEAEISSMRVLEFLRSPGSSWKG
ncbi:MAG: protoporphyrinogen oxidase [Candidatus Eisenbacteria bacterium]|uniref:Coproporphyrinogen III oxidase n=1 Tax=Eiseniibacteriota bacterium TaxID=2212470 RepID=A0A948RYL2_UNCEI|nr:protoporphyrinogen oxidase [Candidatus Eisenbacteria bacterium]MBU1948068.1 protoporphyrinogen oxidase [Candidatus Eisenbacteria bacterium]MBU2691497.1 protoporphyrinogen oxidase [Candidatus Eisenbacteria bacterium]